LASSTEFLHFSRDTASSTAASYFNWAFFSISLVNNTGHENGEGDEDNEDEDNEDNEDEDNEDEDNEDEDNEDNEEDEDEEGGCDVSLRELEREIVCVLD